MGSTETSIPCRDKTRKEIKSLKRGGESYDELLQKMVSQYDPTERDP